MFFSIICFSSLSYHTLEKKQVSATHNKTLSLSVLLLYTSWQHVHTLPTSQLRRSTEKIPSGDKGGFVKESNDKCSDQLCISIQLYECFGYFYFNGFYTGWFSNSCQSLFYVLLSLLRCGTSSIPVKFLIQSSHWFIFSQHNWSFNYKLSIYQQISIIFTYYYYFHFYRLTYGNGNWRNDNAACNAASANIRLPLRLIQYHYGWDAWMSYRGISISRTVRLYQIQQDIRCSQHYERSCWYVSNDLSYSISRDPKLSINPHGYA